MAQAYCVKCKARREIRNPRAVVMRNRRKAVGGTCPACNTKVFRIVPK